MARGNGSVLLPAQRARHPGDVNSTRQKNKRGTGIQDLTRPGPKARRLLLCVSCVQKKRGRVYLVLVNKVWW